MAAGAAVAAVALMHPGLQFANPRKIKGRAHTWEHCRNKRKAPLAQVHDDGSAAP